MQVLYRTTDGQEFTDFDAAQEHEVGIITSQTTVRQLIDALDAAGAGGDAEDVRNMVNYCVEEELLPIKPKQAKVRVYVGESDSPEWRILTGNGNGLEDQYGRPCGAVTRSYAGCYCIVPHEDNDQELVARLLELGATTRESPEAEEEPPAGEEEPPAGAKCRVRIAKGYSPFRYLAEDGDTLNDDSGYRRGGIKGHGHMYRIVRDPENDPRLVAKLLKEGYQYASSPA